MVVYCSGVMVTNVSLLSAEALKGHNIRTSNIFYNGFIATSPNRQLKSIDTTPSILLFIFTFVFFFFPFFFFFLFIFLFLFLYLFPLFFILFFYFFIFLFFYFFIFLFYYFFFFIFFSLFIFLIFFSFSLTPPTIVSSHIDCFSLRWQVISKTIK